MWSLEGNSSNEQEIKSSEKLNQEEALKQSLVIGESMALDNKSSEKTNEAINNTAKDKALSLSKVIKESNVDKWIQKNIVEENLIKIWNWESLDNETISEIQNYIKEQRENSDSNDREELFKKIENEIDFSEKTLEEHKNNIKKFLYNDILNTLNYNSWEQSNLMKKIWEYLDNNYQKLDWDNNGNYNKEERILMSNWIKEFISNLLDWQEKKLDTKLAELIENNFKVEYSVNLDINDTKYRSIDNYNPEIDSSIDNSEKLWSLLDKHKNNQKFNIQTLNTKNENNPEEIKELKNIITEFYWENKELIIEKLWITDITNLTPKQAAQLVSFITMSKLDYAHIQMVFPWNDNNSYYENSSIDEQMQYKESFSYTLYLAPLIDIRDNMWQEKNSVLLNLIDKDINELVKWLDLENKTPTEVKLYMKEYLYTIMEPIKKDLWLTWENDITKIIDNNYWDYNLKNIFLQISDQNTANDHKSISELLKWWQWVCRNYAIVNEKLFEVLKGMQNPNDNKLRNSALPYYTWSDSNYEISINEDANSENHAWNTLITAWENNDIYIAQIETTQVDTWWREWWKAEWLSSDETINNVENIDRTFDRLLNDISNQATEEWFKEVDSKLKSYIIGFENSWWDVDKIINLKYKLMILYKTLWKQEEYNNIEISIKESLSININDLSDGVNHILKKYWRSPDIRSLWLDVLTDKYWKNIDYWNMKDCGILLYAFRNITGAEKEWFSIAQNIYNKSFSKNEEFINLTLDDKLIFIDNTIDNNELNSRLKWKIQQWTFNKI